MFYQCPSCKNVWQYPIEKCPHCFEKLQRLISKKIKVIGISKVTIPTFLHPKVPYFVLVLQDEYGNRWVQKSEIEYKIGQDFKIEGTSDKNAVVIWRVKYDFFDALEKVSEFLGLCFENFSKILILPTLNTPQHPYFRENTSPEFLDAILNFLISKNIAKEKIKVLGQSFNQFEITASAFKSQLLSVCQKNSILPFNIAEGEFSKIDEFEICKEVFENSLILNLPILKSGKLSASENLLKLLKRENYFSLEYLSSKEEILKKLLSLLPNVLTIAEAHTIQRENKTTVILGLVLASFNCLNLERIFYEIIMTKELPEILRECKIENIPVVGRKISEVQVEIEKI